MGRTWTRLACTIALLLLSGSARAQQQPGGEAAAALRTGSSPMREVVERYLQDGDALRRRWDVPYSAERRDRFQQFYQDWRGQLRALDFDALDQEGRIDYVLLDGELRYRLAMLAREAKQSAEMAPLLPFTATLADLQQRRRAMEKVQPEVVAARLDSLARVIEAARSKVEAATRSDSGRAGLPSRVVALRAVNALRQLRRTFEGWYNFYAGYDPLFSWWAADPFRRADTAVAQYTRVLRERVVGIRPGEDEPIVGDPIGAEGLKADLEHELIAYSPEDLIRIAEREFAWCEAEMKKASREMGLGDDWKQALERVKQQHVAPGEQTELTRRLAQEAIDFVESRDLVTVPPLAKEIWRMEMLSPEAQKTSPFYLGGEVIMVSFPTAEMSHEQKLMSMRGNNIHFSRAVVHHELIPGHHLQGFMQERYQPHRSAAFGTPFWHEGNSVYWEMVLWDKGFPQSPEDRVGMLFWRMHRAARIIFSLNFHLGRMSPQEAIDFLVDRVGHERDNATAEVRRSFNGSYPPLYQSAYMLGALQFRALRHELVDSGKMTEREYHDAILQGGSMPIEMVRARLAGTPLTRDYGASWRF